MLGAIIGDIVGSRFEWNNIKTKNFELFDPKYCRPTDDSIMSIAVAKAILESNNDLHQLGPNAVKYMQQFGRMYPNAGYGGRFIRWILERNPKPYNSFGNGAAMRVSACGYAGNSLAEVKALANEVTNVTHDHEESLKAAVAVSSAIYLARMGNTKEYIKEFIEDGFYELDFTLDEIRDSYTFDVTCQGSVPQAFEAFFESDSFEDAIRNAISIGGDSDTIAAITGSIAEAYYGIPEAIISEALSYLDANMVEVIYYFEKNYSSIATDCYSRDGNPIRKGVFEIIDSHVDHVISKGSTGLDIYDEDGNYIHTLFEHKDMKPDFESYGDASTHNSRKKHLTL